MMVYIFIINMFSSVCCAIFHMHYFTFSHKKHIYETVSHSVHIVECIIPVLNIYINSILHFKYKIEIKIFNNTHQNILIYKSSHINYVAMIIYIYVQRPYLKYCYLKNTDTNTGNLINSTKPNIFADSDIIYFIVFSHYNIMFTGIQVSLVIMYLLLTNSCNHKICVATFTQTPFMYYDTSTFLHGGALPIISLLHTLHNTFNKNFLIMYLGIPRKRDNVSSLIDLKHIFSIFMYKVTVQIINQISYRLFSILHCMFYIHHHSCRSHATKTAFISSTTLRCLSIHLAVAPEISTSWYQYAFSLGFSWSCLCSGDVGATWSLSVW